MVKKQKLPVTTEKPLPDVAYETLNQLHGGTQEKRVVGYYKSQSFRHLMRDLKITDPDIIKIRGTRRINEEKHDILFYGYDDIKHYIHPEETRRKTVILDYEKPRHGTFNRQKILNWLNEEENQDIYDIPIDEIIFKLKNNTLYTQLWELIQQTLINKYGNNLNDTNAFQQPFYAVLKGEKPGHPRIHTEVKKYHPKRYFLTGDTTTPNGKRGLGQKVRTLDLKAIWSHRAFTNTTNIIATIKDNGQKQKFTLKDIENQVINHAKKEQPQYGAINSMLLINNFKKAFHNGTNHKSFQWKEQEGWIQTN